ncbi:MAG: DUF6062 family protein [Chloroflexota bacterium]
MTERAPKGDRPGRTAVALQDAIAKNPRNCPVCVVVQTRLRHYVDTLFYELVNDPPTRERIRRARGFCRYHARMISEQSDALGAAIILCDVLENDFQDISNGLFDLPAQSTNPIRRLLGRRSGQPELAPCPLCVSESETEYLVVDSLLERLDSTTFSIDFPERAGICVPHFRLAYDRCGDGPRWRKMTAVQRTAVQRLIEELNDLARAYDYHVTEKPTAEQAEVWRRALRFSSRQFEP